MARAASKNPAAEKIPHRTERSSTNAGVRGRLYGVQQVMHLLESYINLFISVHFLPCTVFG